MRENVRAEVVRSVVPFVVGTLLYQVSGWGSFRSFPKTWFYEAGPGASPPWYFMGQDFVEGLWAAGGFVLLCAFTWAASRRLGSTVWAAFGVSAVSFISRIGAGINVWLNTSHLGSADQASSTWMTFDEYLRGRKLADDVSLACAMVVMVCALGWYARRLQRESAQ